MTQDAPSSLERVTTPACVQVGSGCALAAASVSAASFAAAAAAVAAAFATASVSTLG